LIFLDLRYIRTSARWSGLAQLDCGGTDPMRSARLALAVLALAAVAALGAAPAGADGVTNPKHFFWGQGSSPQGTVDALSNDIIYHGGSAGPGAIGVEIKPAVYLIYWGPDWVQGFTVTDANGKTFSSKTPFPNEFDVALTLFAPQLPITQSVFR